MKNLIFSLIALTSFTVHSSVKAKWFGITSILISDEKTTLLFDPVVTRPSLFKILTFQNIDSDETLVKKWIEKLSIKKADGIFISHSHADHCLDAPNFAKLTGAKLYGSETTGNIGRSYQLTEAQIVQFKIGDKYSIGNFKIEVIESIHSPIAFGIQLFDGEVKTPFKRPTSYATYKMGGSFVYMITHPKGKIFFHPSASIISDYKDLTADILFQGIASRKSTQYLHDKVINFIKPQKIIPLHWDNFFDSDIENASELLTVNTNEFIESTKKILGKNIVELPIINKEIILFP